MTYASDKLNKEVIRPMRGRLVKILKASELLPHLSCLTDTDREEILAKKLTDGNQSAVMILLDNLVRREGWPECFIEALRLCEQMIAAEEIQDAYDKIKGTRKKTAASAPVRGASAAVCATAATAAPESPQSPAPPSTAAPLPPVQPEVTVTAASPQNIPPVNPFPLTPLEAPAQSAAPAHIKSPLSNVTVQVEGPIVALAPEAPVLPDPKPAHTADPQLSGIAPHVRPDSSVSAPKEISSPDRNEHSATSTATPEPSLDAVSPNTVTTSFPQLNSPCTTSQVPAALEESRTPVAVEELKHPIQDTSPVSKLPVLARNSQNNTKIHQTATRSFSPVPNFQNEATSSGAAQVSPSGAAQVSPSGAAQVSSSGAAQVSSLGAAQVSSSGAAQVSPSGAAQVSSSGAAQVSPLGAAQVSPLGAAQVSPSGAAQVSSSGAAQVSSSGAAQVSSSGAAQVSPSGAAQVSPSGAAQVSPSGAAQVSSSGAVPGQVHRVAADPEEYFSKPNVLEAERISRVTAFTSPVQSDTSASCSITSADLMISRSTTEHVSENATEICTSGASPNLNSGSPSRNTTSYLREPVEDHYESGIITNTFQISEMPSVQDLHSPVVAGNAVHTNSLSQSLRSEAQPIKPNQETLRNNFVASGQTRPTSDVDKKAQETGNSGQINAPESDNGDESQSMLSSLQSDPRFLAAAAAVCVIGIFMAWKHK